MTYQREPVNRRHTRNLARLIREERERATAEAQALLDSLTEDEDADDSSSD